MILYFQRNKFPWLLNLRESFNTLDKWAIELCNRNWNVDINVFIFSIFFFSYINLESENILWARTLAIFINKFVFMFYKYLISILFSIFFFTTKIRTIKLFFSSLFWFQWQIVLVKLFQNVRSFVTLYLGLKPFVVVSQD